MNQYYTYVQITLQSRTKLKISLTKKISPVPRFMYFLVDINLRTSYQKPYCLFMYVLM